MVTILTDLINYHYFFPLNEEPFSWDQFVCVISINISLWFLCQRRQWHPTPVLLPGKSHGQRSVVGCSPWGRKESDTTERLHFHFSLSCIGEGNGNPLQCSCLENPRDGGAWWAAVYGVAQSQTRLMWHSSWESSKLYISVVHFLCWKVYIITYHCCVSGYLHHLIKDAPFWVSNSYSKTPSHIYSVILFSGIWLWLG